MFRISRQLIEKILTLVFVCFCFQLSSKAQCEANYTVTVDSVLGNIQCTNTSTVAFVDSPTVYTWYETPGNVLSNSVNPTIPFDQGQHNVCLIVENEGCLDTLCTVITMPPRYCKAQYSYWVDNTTGTVTFTNQSIGAAGSYFWSFGDGNSFSTDSNTSFTYESGWYYVCLNSYNADSTCNDVTCQFIKVQRPTPIPCVAEFGYEYDTLNSKVVHFANQTFNDSITVIWLFPGDSSVMAEQTTFDFGSVGFYKVCMLVSGGTCADSICKTIEVIEILPVCDADFSYRLFADSVYGGSPRIAVFENKSTGSNLTYEWRINDSLVSQSEDPIYYFAGNGLYKVCLTTRYQQFCSDSTCSMISILSSATQEIESNTSGNVGIFPNPAETFVTIEPNPSLGAVEYIRIYSVLGNIVYDEYNPGRTTISLANCTKGLYIVEVKTKDYLIRQKLNKR